MPNNEVNTIFYRTSSIQLALNSVYLGYSMRACYPRHSGFTELRPGVGTWAARICGGAITTRK